MGYQELIASLRKEGEEKIKTIRAETEAEAEKIKAEAAGKIEQLREDFRKGETKLIRDQEKGVLSAAENQVRIIRLTAEKSLSDRLFKLALSCLHELRTERYESVFSSLVKELPSASWNEVSVNPEDAGMAGAHLPDSRIISDYKITGGLEVFRENRKQHIINTFEKRLERAWEKILPFLIIDTYREAARHGISSGH
jgi:vacuolar-type H+-ATPase subunit E/Vma4